MTTLNYESIVYIGDRDGVAKEWRRRRFIFKQGKSVMVPDEFAGLLLSRTLDFCREEEVNKTVCENWPGGGHLLMRRWGAMGDLLMLRASVAAFCRVHPEFTFTIRCQVRFKHLFVHDDLWAGVIGMGDPRDATEFTGIAMMDQVAEADHRGVEAHRSELFLRKLDGLEHEIELTAADWEMPIPSPVVKWVADRLCRQGLQRQDRNRPLIAVQVRGSGEMKSLPLQVAKRLIQRMVVVGDVILIENDSKVADECSVSDQVFTMPGRDVLHGIELLKNCDVAVTMDSGPLWMAHSALCPVVAILGPTRPAQRTSMHPVRAEAVALNELIDCPACFERADACNHKYTCMRDQPNWDVVVDLIAGRVEAILAGTVSLPVLSPTV